MTLDDQDAATIAELARAGVDLRQPHTLRHYLYVPNDRIAKLLAPRIADIGFAVETSPAAEGDRWLILLSGEAMLTLEELRASRETLEGLAAKVDGTYDGWEVAV